ncbi:hypothetical protein BLNAU_14110 [Blattamonas nauphoetae]|uniref:DUF676 domain-containing protein n=1 Tax=Blattamonas nauphoetae TaxID=2049346 RepID=A0ABQ9XL99_9EUKA|nr:hypothetical protein BLNAU_14110 [Blattamonas nauphoetae]
MNPSPPKSYPFVLVHGAVRYDVLWNSYLAHEQLHLFDTLIYFKNLRHHLVSKGFDVEQVKLRWSAGVDTEAKILLTFVQNVMKQYNTDRIHLVCHSYGGLVARHMLWNYQNIDIAKVCPLPTLTTPQFVISTSSIFLQHVLSLTTLSTPHLGSSLALYFLGFPIGGSYRKFLKTLPGNVTLESLRFPIPSYSAKEENEILFPITQFNKYSSSTNRCPNPSHH